MQNSIRDDALRLLHTGTSLLPVPRCFGIGYSVISCICSLGTGIRHLPARQGWLQAGNGGVRHGIHIMACVVTGSDTMLQA